MQMPEQLKAYETWLRYPHLFEEMRAELAGIQDEKEEINDRFYRHLSFGTGGLRGKMGAGTNRMNAYTIIKATKALAQYLKGISELPSCAIGFDSRNHSLEFAQLASAVLVSCGVRVHLFEELIPTPILSFAVHYLRCEGGVMITASHNPKEYNGYKVYDKTGCQIGDEAARRIEEFMEAEDDLVSGFPDFDSYLEQEKICIIGSDVRDAFLEAVMKHSIQLPPQALHAVYSPLNGTGNRPVRQILSKLPNISVSVVPAQEQPDGDFPTTPKPNPQLPQAMDMSVELMLKLDADICLATDPDADRIGVGVRTASGSSLLSGNQVGVLLFHFICEGLKSADRLPQNPVAIKTIVTTPMAEKIASAYNVELYNVLTGFKYIGSVINQLARDNKADRFIFAFEESIGYLVGPYIREKDSIGAAMLICEMASHYKSCGMSLLDAFQTLEERYGCYVSVQESIRFEGEKGEYLMKKLLDTLREANEVAGAAVLEKTDYLHDDTGLPRSNVLLFKLEGGLQIIIRPSGTEPLLKFYIDLACENTSEGELSVEKYRQAMLGMIKNLQQ